MNLQHHIMSSYKDYKDELAELCECDYPKGSSSSLGL